ncbi:MAG: biotin/lipoyl-containing protein, partial [Gammaproteobacteria bacterium]
MSNTTEIRIPDIGGFEGVEVIDVLVAAGDKVAKEDSLITLESDKAAMDVPAPQAGTIKEIKVKTGDKVSEGDVIAIVETADDNAEENNAGEDKKSAAKEKPDESDAETDRETEEQSEPKQDEDEPSVQKPERKRADSADKHAFEEAKKQADLACEVLVLGSGPGGYTAAFRASDLGRDVVMVERYASLGG